ncbi:MAG: sulfotransferase domain-containing protein [Candidatus Rokuibacteriota bacterium]
MLVWVASYPRSGNTLFRILLNRTYGVVTASLYPGEADEAGPHAAVASAIGAVPLPLPPAELAARPEPWFVKTHELPTPDHPALYLVRDGRDVLVSHAHYVLDYDRGLAPAERPDLYRQTLRMLIETDASFGGWGRHVLSWLDRAVPTAVVRFEDLVRTPLACLRQAMRQLGLGPAELPEPRIPPFEDLHGLAPRFFRGGRTGAWRDEMPDDLHRLFWRRHGDAMRRLGYACPPGSSRGS